MIRPHINNILRHDISQSWVAQEMTTKVCLLHSEEERRSDGQDWPCPSGLRIFYHPASFILVAVAITTASSSYLAGLIKYLATRLEDIIDMGSYKIKNFGFAVAAATTEYEGIDLTIQSVFGIITGLACWFTRFALILIVVYIIIYGLKFMMAQGNQNNYEEAKKSFWWGLVGVLVIIGTYTIIATVANFLGGDYNLIPFPSCS